MTIIFTIIATLVYGEVWMAVCTKLTESWSEIMHKWWLLIHPGPRWLQQKLPLFDFYVSKRGSDGFSFFNFFHLSPVVTSHHNETRNKLKDCSSRSFLFCFDLCVIFIAPTCFSLLKTGNVTPCSHIHSNMPHDDNVIILNSASEKAREKRFAKTIFHICKRQDTISIHPVDNQPTLKL